MKVFVVYESWYDGDQSSVYNVGVFSSHDLAFNEVTKQKAYWKQVLETPEPFEYDKISNEEQYKQYQNWDVLIYRAQQFIGCTIQEFEVDVLTHKEPDPDRMIDNGL